jgi:hypothetical protein
MHDPNDRVVAFRHTKKYLGMMPRATYLEHYFGHKFKPDLLSAFWKEIDKFVKINYLSDEERAKHLARQKAEEKKVHEIKKFEKALKNADKDGVEIKVIGSDKDDA